MEKEFENEMGMTEAEWDELESDYNEQRFADDELNEEG